MSGRVVTLEQVRQANRRRVLEDELFRKAVEYAADSVAVAVCPFKGFVTTNGVVSRDRMRSWSRALLLDRELFVQCANHKMMPAFSMRRPDVRHFTQVDVLTGETMAVWLNIEMAYAVLPVYGDDLDLDSDRKKAEPGLTNLLSWLDAYRPQRIG